MNLIARYVYAVAQYLPKDSRDDVVQELRTNIEDMLPESYTEEDVYEVLEELGSPLQLANEYNPRKRYLIGPGLFDKYLAMLKLVVGICIAVSVSVALVVGVVNSSEVGFTQIIELFANVIAGAFIGAVQGAFWVTLIFVILEKTGVEVGHLPHFQEKWTPDSLPEIPKDDSLKISRGVTIFSIICTITFTALLYFQPQLIALYSIDENSIRSATPLFELDRLKVYMLFIFALAVIQLGLFVWKYIAERWNRPLLVGNTLHNVLMCILVVVMLRDSVLFNPEFVPAIAELTKGSMDIIATWFERGKWIFAVSFIGVCTWDSLSTFYKYKVKN